MKLNLPNKITVARIIIAIIVLILLMIPWHDINVDFPEYIVHGEILSLKYIIVGILFIIASLTDFVDGKIARSRNMVTDFGKVADAIADKVLVNGLLIVLAYNRIKRKYLREKLYFQDKLTAKKGLNLLPESLFWCRLVLLTVIITTRGP